MKKILLVALLLVVIAMVGFYLALMRTPTKEQVPVDTMPVTTDTDNQDSTDTVTTATMSDEKSGILFTYPTDLDSQYISVSEWPPRFISSFAPIDCELDEQTKAMSGQTDTTATINGTSYCIWERNEGAAGSTYTNYQVSYEKNNQYLTMSFTLQYPQCGNYPDAEKVVCENEQKNFPLYDLMDEIAQSASLPSY
jgi:hypothetical protein